MIVSLSATPATTSIARSGLAVTPFDLPDGCLGGYYPEMNVLDSAMVSRQGVEDAGLKGGASSHSTLSMGRGPIPRWAMLVFRGC